ncbi:Protein CBG00298 [Caenorhabditis briggsae]|uniref:Protein CBG00298 n=1 Tax=Caenorhabditis briggsae TaxID=6238 RepID=A8WMM9_CAEBR|nr:Protein CBG00298 [Caenorhabditis briggsae]CAP21734.1 Protein CBG00298 [Caenorhabditis briggsae]
MQYKACLSDLQYWKSWVETYGIPKNVLESRKSPSTVPAKRKLWTSGQTDNPEYFFAAKPGIENNEPFKKSSNNPRVPLLDVPVHRGKLLKQSKYKEYCEYFCKVLKEKQSCAETEKSIKCICFHCPGDTRITTVMELLQHVFNSKHAENIRFLANREDFTYHEDIIRKMPRIQTPAAVSRTPAIRTYSTFQNLFSFRINIFESIEFDMIEKLKNYKFGLLYPVYLDYCTQSMNRVTSHKSSELRAHSFTACNFVHRPATVFKILTFTAYVVRPDYTQGGQRILNSTPPMIAPMSAPIPTDPVHRTVSATPTPTQTPRTLCKLPCFGLRPVYMSKERTKPTEAQLSFINGLTSDGGTSGLPYVADGTYCGCCDEDMTGWDVVRIACHVFSDSHLRKLANLVYVCDFQHWIDMIERRGLASTPQAAKPGSVSAQTVTQSSIEQRTPHSASVVRPDPPIVRQSVVQRPIPQVVRTRCTLPLYVSCPTIDPTGPFNSQVSFINRVAIRGIEATRSYVADGTFCGFCNVDMTGYNLIRVVKHAFSINHLRKLDNLPHLSVFQHWIIMIERSDFVLTPQFTSSPLQFKSSPLYTLLGLKSMKAALNDFDVFSNFSPTQMELISNVDMAKIEQCAELLNEFGGCIYCEKWLLTGREVFEHWIPQQHFLKIRQQHPVSRRRMDIFMEYASSCENNVVDGIQNFAS